MSFHVNFSLNCAYGFSKICSIFTDPTDDDATKKSLLINYKNKLNLFIRYILVFLV